MVLCFVRECKNRSDFRNCKTRKGNEDQRITFHKFPKKLATLSLWSNILEISPEAIPSGARICSIHFEEKFFDRTSPFQVRLKPDAVPRKESLDVLVSRDVREDCPMPTTMDRALSPIRDDSSSRPTSSRVNKSTTTSFRKACNSPENCTCKRRIEILKEKSRKKIRTLQQKVRRQTDQITALKCRLKVLQKKQLSNEGQADTLRMLGGSNGQLFNQLIRRRSSESVDTGRPYQSEPVVDLPID